MKNSKSPFLKILLLIIIITLVFFVVLGGINALGSLISSQTASHTDDLLSRRFNGIGQKLMFAGQGGGSVNYVDERWGLVKMSWSTFLNNPIFGVGYTVGNVYSKLFESGVGTHSEICDILAQHGIVGASLFFMYFFNAIKRLGLKIIDHSYLIVLFVMALMNPFHYFHGFFVIMVLTPIICALVQDYTSHQSLS